MSRVVNLWLNTAQRPDLIEFIISVDEDYNEGITIAKNLANYRLWKGAAVRFVTAPVPGNCVKGWNAAAAASTGKVLIAVADDFRPEKNWDAELVNIHPAWVESECVVKVSDGYNKDLCTLGIITRKRYERFGYFFFPGYESLFSDTELTARALQDNVLLKAEHLVFEHIHPDCSKRERDAVDLKHASKARWDSGETLFNYRAARGFPDDSEEEFAATESSGLDIYAVFCLAIKDDFCLYDVLKRVADEGVKNIYLVTPDQYWAGHPTPPEDIEQVKAVAKKLADDGYTVRHRVVEVAKYRKLNTNRVGIETMVRNEALHYIRADGFKHVVVVDGDELWRTGLMAKLDRLVKTQHPTGVTTGMVPVIGLPGLPIRDAKDKVTIYMRSDVSFRECRSPWGISADLPGYEVIHFSATRKSMDEIVGKMRESGHYDDPSYDFDNFIKNILPAVQPGSKNLHMFKHWQIWPEAGTWSQREMDDIPESMRPYLSDVIGPDWSPSTQGETPWKTPTFVQQSPVLTQATTAAHPAPAMTTHGYPKANHPRRTRRW